MSATAKTTADELLAMPSGKSSRYELVAGELRTLQLHGWRHGEVVSNLGVLLGLCNIENKLGIMLAGAGFLLHRDPDTVLAPDYAFVSKQSLSKGTIGDCYWAGAPDLAVEVLSPSDNPGEVAGRIKEWLAAGCEAVWIVNPELKIVTVYQPATNVRVVTAGDVLVGDPVVPGFTCAVNELFR